MRLNKKPRRAVAKAKRVKGYKWKLIVFDKDHKTYLGEEEFDTEDAYGERIDEVIAHDMICYDGDTGELFNFETIFNMAGCRL